MAKINLDELIDIAFAHEEGDPFDWGSFKQGKEQARSLGETKESSIKELLKKAN